MGGPQAIAKRASATEGRSQTIESWHTAILRTPTTAEDLMDSLEADGHLETEGEVLDNPHFQVRWR